MPSGAGPVVQRPRTPAFQAGNAGSNPVGATNRNPCSTGVSARLEIDRLGGLGHAWATNGLGDGVETVGGLVVEAVHEVPVAVDGDLDRGVPEPGLDGFGVFTGGDQPDRQRLRR